MTKHPTKVEFFTFDYQQNLKAELEEWAHEHKARILSASVDRSAHSLVNSTLLAVIVGEPLSDGRDVEP